jgi:5-methylcytosine-specific restriction endonuclease McrA
MGGFIGDGMTDERRAKRNEWERKRRQEHPEKIRKYMREYAREWRARNREKARALVRQHYEKHKRIVLTKNKTWRLQNPEKYARRVATERLRRKNKLQQLQGNQDGYGEKVLWIRKGEYVECLYCGLPIPLGHRHVDHIVPLALGGWDCTDNIGPACDRCNWSKGPKHPLLFWAKKASTLLEIAA